MSLYKFYPNFSVIFRRFLSADPIRKLVEELYFFEVGCKGKTPSLLNQIFLSFFTPSITPVEYPTLSENYCSF
jgi:hypothetical protein